MKLCTPTAFLLGCNRGSSKLPLRPRLRLRTASYGTALFVAACLYGFCCSAFAVNPDNVVVRWDQAALDAIRITRTSPPIAARALAITHTCIFDAWAAYDDFAFGTRMGDRLRRPKAEHTLANKEQAINFAAYRALIDLFPSQKTTLFDPLMRRIGLDPSDTSMNIDTPDGIGNAACLAVIEFRHTDGANQNGELYPGTYSDYTAFTPANTSGMLQNRDRWQPLLVNGTPQNWLLPQWPFVKPFALTGGSQFRNGAMAFGPYRYATAAYWKQAFDVIDLSAQLTDTEKVIAEYWADGAGTITPPGHWCFFAQEISRRDRHSLDDDVKLFFILGNALLDASIATWDVKRYTDSIRPVTVVRALLGNREVRAWAGPGLGARMIKCKDFRPYLPTPPFGSFVSGHSAFSAAAAEILRRFTKSDEFGDSFTAEPGSSLIEVGLVPSAPVRLSWSTFSQAADQAGMSRRFGGIHFESDDLAGRALGRVVASQVWKTAAVYIQGAVAEIVP